MSGDQPKPCFKCDTEPRMEGHVVCPGCHDDRVGACHVCYPIKANHDPVRTTGVHRRRPRSVL